jgi:hypothetical protein
MSVPKIELSFTNGLKLNIYPFDNDETVINRVASVVKEFPEFVYIYQGLKQLSRKDISDYINLGLSKNKDFRPATFSVRKLSEVVSQMVREPRYRNDINAAWKEVSGEYKNLSRDNFVFLWILSVAERRPCESIFEAKDPVSFQLLEYTRLTSQLICDHYQRKLAQVRQTMIENDEFVKDFDLLVDIATRFDQKVVFLHDSVQADIRIKTDPGYVRLFTVFQNTRLNDITPFVYYHENNIFQPGEKYRALKGFTAPSKWIHRIEGESAVVTRVSQAAKPKLELVTLDDDYGKAVWTVDSDDSTILNLKIRVLVNSQVKVDEVIDRFLSNITLPSNLPSDAFMVISKNITMGGYYSIPRVVFNRYLLIDAFTNNKEITKFFYLDEELKSSGEKKNIKVHLRDFRNMMPHISASITQYRADKPYYGGLIKAGDPYLNVRLVAPVRHIIVFQSLLQFALEEYKKTAPRMRVLYSSLMPDLKMLEDEYGVKSVQVKEVSKLRALQEYDSTVFKSKEYSRKCLKQFQPIPVYPDELQTLDENDTPYIEFPEGSSKYYKCEDSEAPEYIYPYLKQNKGSIDLPFVPCCGKSNANYREAKKSSKQVQTKFRQLEIGSFGVLPSTLKLFFDQSPFDSVLRMGVTAINARDSILHCLLTIFDKDYRTQKQSQRNEYVNQFRTRLASDDRVFYSSSQETYGYGLQELKTIISSADAYVDPRLFAGLLEVYFKCRIVMFTITDDEPGGKFLRPRHNNGYYNYALDKTEKVVLIFCHRVENIYVSELIVKDREEPSKVFIGGQDVASTLYSMYLRSMETFTTDGLITTRVEPTPRPVFNITNYPAITSQVIDSFGKRRGVVCEGGAVIVHSPLKPLAVTPMSSFDGFPIPTAGVIYDYIQKRKELPAVDEISIVGWSTVNDVRMAIIHEKLNQPGLKGKLTQLKVVYGMLYVPNDEPDGESQIIDSLAEIRPLTDLQVLYTRQESVLASYEKAKLAASYYEQFALYLFSHFISNRSKAVDTLDVKQLEMLLEMAQTQMFVVDSSFNFTKRMEQLDDDKLSLDIVVYRGNRLVVQTEGLKTKLIYYLKRMIHLSTRYVVEYKSTTSIYGFKSIRPTGELAFDSLRAVTMWYANTHPEYQIHKTTDETHSLLTIPYVVRTTDNKVCIAQNCKSIESASTIWSNWHKHNINTGINTINQTLTNQVIRVYSVDKQGYIHYKETKQWRGTKWIKLNEDEIAVAVSAATTLAEGLAGVGVKHVTMPINILENPKSKAKSENIFEYAVLLPLTKPQ